MKYVGYPLPTVFQIGSNVYTIENDLNVNANIVNTKTIVTFNGQTIVTNYYQLEGYGSKWFPEAELFATSDELKDYLFP